MNHNQVRYVNDILDVYPNWVPRMHELDDLRAHCGELIEAARKLRAEHPEDIGSNYTARMKIMELEELINRILWRMHHPLVTVFHKGAKDEAPKA